MNPEPRASQPLTSTSQAPQAPTSMSPVQQFSPQCSPLVPPAMPYPSYPSSTLNTYYPNPSTAQNFAHISTHTSSPPLHFSPILLPSASQSRVPTIRGTPSPLSINQLDMNIEPRSPPYVPFMSPLLSPLVFPQQFPLPYHSPPYTVHSSQHASPQSLRNAPAPHNSILFSPHSQPILNTAYHFSPARNNPLFLNSPVTTQPQLNTPLAVAHPPISYENCCSPEISHLSYENHRSSLQTKNFLKITLPSTKDIPILMGKHDWGPWHTAV